MASSIVRTFSSLTKEFNISDLMSASLPSFSWAWENFRKRSDWYADQVLNFPFEAGEISNGSFGALTAAAAITELQGIKGTITAQPEAYFATKFNHKDIDCDNLKASFLKLYPRKIKQFAKFCSSVISQQAINGAQISAMKAVADGGIDPVLNDGVMYLDNPERIRIGQKLDLYDTVKGKIVVYVKSIVVSSGKIVVCSNITLATVVDFTVAGNQVIEANSGAVYIPGCSPADANGLTSMSSILLPSGTGDGTANYAGKVKATYPFLQAVAVDGSGIDADNILDELIDAFQKVEQLGQGAPDVMVMSLKHLYSISKLLKENLRGDYAVSPVKKVAFGHKSFMLGGPHMSIEVVGIREMNEDKIFILDKSTWVWCGSCFFEPMDYGNGDHVYPVRETTGVSFIQDMKFYGDLICEYPSHNGVIHTVSY